MPSDFAFRLCTYLTLGLSCLALGYSEWDLLPEVTVFTAVVIVLLAVSFVLEGRWVLGLREANRMGFAIGVVAILWVGFQFIRPSGGLIYLLPWPASLLPYLGPLLMVLMPAKLFRPKHANDWWAMHGIALVGVALACAITDDEVFAALLILYTASGVLSVALFFARWNAGLIPAPPNEAPRPPTAVLSAPTRRRPAARALREAAAWTGAALLLALPLFFIAPPSPGAKWHLSVKGGIETGLSAERSVDLDRSGTVQTNRDVAAAFTVARPDGSAYDDAPAVLRTRFKGGTYYDYNGGKWSQDVTYNKLFWVRVATRAALPDAGPNGAVFDFRPTRHLSRPVTAEPLFYRPGEPNSVVTFTGVGVRQWGHLTDGTVTPLNVAYPGGHVQRYQQVVDLAAPADLGPGYELQRGDQLPDGADQAMARLTQVNAPRVVEWAQKTLDDLVKRGKLPAGVLDRAKRDDITLRRSVAPQDFRAVGEAFRDVLASPAFSYSLTLGRVDRNLDPIEDFLLNHKTGHCERFAAALALAVRAVGIPSAFVLGYSHAEEDEEKPGRYLIRQDSTHAWAQILIPLPTPADYPGLPPTSPRAGEKPAELWHWLTLDPTPTVEAAADAKPGVEGWIDSARWASVLFYNNYIVGYNAERRQQVVALARGHFRQNGAAYAVGLAALAGLAFGVVLVRRLGSPAADVAADAGRPPPPGWYGDLVAALDAAGVPARQDVTPRELLAAASLPLAERPGGVAARDGLARAVAGLERQRYRGDALTAAEEAELAADAAPAVALLAAPSPQNPRAR